MDDESFKKELLTRLDTIIELLSSALPEACLEESPPSELPEGDDAPKPANEFYLIGEEMQEDYAAAVQKWKQQQDGK